MSDHYYSKSPKSEKVIQTLEYEVNDESFLFTSSAGVFSKNDVDFGSQLLIETFEQPVVNGKVLDLGCGYGPIGITLARFFSEREVMMVDINERAVSLAKQNAEQNKVTNVNIQQSEGFSSIDDCMFAAVVTNPPIRAGKKVIQSLFVESKEHLLPGGELWIVIQKKQGAPSAMRYLATLFEDVNIVNKRKGYFIIRAS